MLRRTDTSIVLQHDADCSAAALFAVLADPRRHVEMDGSGMLRAAENATVIDHLDQVFSMAMHYPSLGDYITENRVIEFEPERRIGWATARRGQPPAGVRWGWQLTALDDAHTRIVHTYDWSRVTDPAVLARVSFPRVTPDQLQASLGAASMLDCRSPGCARSMLRRTTAPTRGRAARTRRRQPVRARLAVPAANLAAQLSRRLGLGDGAIIGGRVALAVDRGALGRLASGRRVVLVTGTNGKTTVAHLLAGILRNAEPVAHNETGANMADRAVAALMARPQARMAVLEVDELHLAAVAEQVQPAVVVLLNLTRDQLDRSTEVTAVAESIRRALQSHPEASVIANGDDPVIVAIAEDVPGVQWVASGANWTGDAALCPRCGGPLNRTGDAWSCPGCGLRRPEPDWLLDGGEARAAAVSTPLVVQLPGEYNRRNALTAVATAAALGIAPADAAAAVAEVRSVAHRYAVVQRVTLLLAKNPAGWREILPLLSTADGLLLAINAREADGRDTSWLWDIPFEQLPVRPTVAAGEAAADLVLRLAYAEKAHDVEADPVRGLRRLPPGNVTVVANYTAFSQLWPRLERTPQS